MTSLASAVDHVADFLDPSYKKAKKVLVAEFHNEQLYSVIFLVFSATSAFFNLTTSFTLANLAITAIFSVPMCYFFYNKSMFYGNLADWALNTNKYLKLNREQQRAKIAENTFCFEWYINSTFEEMAKKPEKPEKTVKPSKSKKSKVE